MQERDTNAGRNLGNPMGDMAGSDFLRLPSCRELAAAPGAAPLVASAAASASAASSAAASVALGR